MVCRCCEKHVFPGGYSEEHYISNDDTLDYVIHFQNNSDALVEDVVIIDTIDLNLDLNSFEPLFSRDDFMTTIDLDSRQVTFFAEDVDLSWPDWNPANSFSWLSYRLGQHDGLAVLTEINNSAEIHMDTLPSFETNTTSSILYDCSLYSAEIEQDAEVLTSTEGTYYQWFLNDTLIEGATDQEFEALEDGLYTVLVRTDFPCSDTSEVLFVNVDALSEATVTPITLFPNPMIDRAMIDFGDLKGTARLEIFDMNGRLLRSTSLSLERGLVELKRKKLSSGAYVLRLRHEKGVTELPFIID